MQDERSRFVMLSMYSLQRSRGPRGNVCARVGNTSQTHLSHGITTRIMSSSSGLGWQSAHSLAMAVEGMLAGSGEKSLTREEMNQKQHRFSRSVDDMNATASSALKPVSLRRIQSDVVSTKGSANVSSESLLRSTHSEDIRKPKKLDKYGFIINMDRQGRVQEDYDEYERVPTFAETKVAERRLKKWNFMLSSWELSKKRRRLLSKRLRKGIPDQVRGTVWPMLGNVPRMKKENVGVYDDLVHQATERTERLPPSQALLQTKSFKATQETIERDIHRTYPRHSMFHEDSEDDEDNILALFNDNEVSDMIAELEQDLNGKPRAPRKTSLAVAEGGQASLRRVLRAYSCYDREVGYCQGMNFIAGMFLTFTSEEDAFWLLVGVMNKEPCRMRGLFGEGMQETHQVLYVAEKLLHQFLPKLAKHLDKENVHITMYATQWMLTLYTSSFKFDLVTRVWDVFLAEGWKVVYRVMLALMQYSSPMLMTMHFEETLAYFRDLPNQVDANKVMDVAFKIPLRKKHILKYEKEYKARPQAIAT